LLWRLKSDGTVRRFTTVHHFDAGQLFREVSCAGRVRCLRQTDRRRHTQSPHDFDTAINGILPIERGKLLQKPIRSISARGSVDARHWSERL